MDYVRYLGSFSIFFFNDTATTEIYTLSLHDALPISTRSSPHNRMWVPASAVVVAPSAVRAKRLSLTGISRMARDRKSTRLNSSHANISYAVFCLKKKKTIQTKIHNPLSYY